MRLAPTPYNAVGINKAKRAPRANWAVPIVPGLRPKTDITIGGKRFQCLTDMGALA